MGIRILREDILPYVYFVCSMAHEAERGMKSSLGSKNDFIGGIFDRWINIIPESVVFNKKILPEIANQIHEETGQELQIEVYSDFFKYDPKIVGIAPDVLGIKVNENIIPFVKYDDQQERKEFWVAQGDSPLIEVKSFKQSQYLVSLRNQNYDDKYLVMCETDLSVDYLLPFFDEAIFSDDVYQKLEVPQEFIESNIDNHLNPTMQILEFNELGTIELLLITTALNFMNNSTKCFGGESPRYIREITQRTTNIRSNLINEPISQYFDRLENGLYRENENFREKFNTPTIKTLDIHFSNPDDLVLLKVNKNGIVVLANENTTVNNFQLEREKQYTIHFNILDRSRASGVDTETDADSEYFFDKKLLSYIEDATDALYQDIIRTIRERMQQI